MGARATDVAKRKETGVKSTRTRWRRAPGVVGLAVLSLSLLAVGPASALEVPQSGVDEDQPSTGAAEEPTDTGVDDQELGSLDGGVLTRLAELLDGSTQSGDADPVVYDDPGHVDVTWVTDEETGEVSEIRSGVTAWSEADGGPSAFALAPASDVLRATVTPGSGNVSANGAPRLRIDIDVPASASEGDEYVLSVSAPFIFPSLNSVEIKDASGKVFALAQTSNGPVAGRDPARNQLAIIFTGEVEAHSGVQGFIEANLSNLLNRNTKTQPVVLTSGGVEVGRSAGNWTVPGTPVETTTVSANGNAFNQGKPAIQPYLRLRVGDIPSPNLVLTFSNLSSGLSPSCEIRGVARTANAAGWIGDRSTSVIEASTCTDTQQVFTIPKVMLTGSGADQLGLGASDVVTFRTYMYGDRELTEYSVTVNANTGAGSVPQGLPRRVSATTGRAPEIGASHLSLLTEKTAGWTSAVEGEQPTVGDTITYTITTSPGAGNERPVTQVYTTDALPPHLQFISATNGGVYNSTSREIIWGPRTLTTTGKFTDVVKAKIVSLPPDLKITNEVRNAAEEACIETDDVSVCEADVTTPLVAPSFKFAKTSTVEDTNQNGWLGDLGDTIRYKFTVTNTGEVTLKTAKFSDDLLNITDRECLTEPLAPGATATCSGSFTHVITASDVDAGTVTNHATMCVDPVLGLDCEPGETTTPVIDPAFTFTKHSEVTVADEGRGFDGAIAGDKITYWFTATNTGNVTLEDVTINDPMLGISGEQCLPAGGSLPAGQTVECVNRHDYTITEADQVAGEVINHATALVPGLPPEEDEVEDPVVDPSFTFDKFIVKITDSAGKPVSGGKAAEGDKIHFGFTATNTGNVDIKTLTVTDPKLGVSGVECLEDSAVLAPDETVTCVDNASYVYTVTASDVKAGEVHNVATGSVPGLPDDEGETTTPVLPNPGAPVLPKTGAGGTWLLVGAGSALMLSGAYMLVRRRRASVRADLPG